MKVNFYVTTLCVTALVEAAILVAPAYSAPATTGCRFDATPDACALDNGLCRILWSKTGRGWSAEFQAQVANQWHTVAWDNVEQDAAYGVVLPGESAKNSQVRANIWGREQSALPDAAVRPEIVSRTAEKIVLRWTFAIEDDQGRSWPVVSTYTIEAGNFHVHEQVLYRSPPKVAEQVRYQRGWEARNVSQDFYEWVAHSLTHTGWKIGDASFLILTSQPNGWDGSRGGGGIVRMTSDKHFIRDDAGYHSPTDDARYWVFHRAPHVVQKEGWIDTRYFDHYTIDHDLILWPGHLFEPQAIAYLEKLQPLEKLPPRYSWKKFLDLQMEGAEHVPGLLEDHGDWAHFELGWYHGFDPDKVHIQRNRQALDWGGNWDLWMAIAMANYGEKYGHAWATQTARKLIHGVKHEMWQVSDPTTLCDGAIWMFRPRTKEEYDQRRNSHPSGEQGGYIRTTSDLWVCQTGKIGALLLDVYQQSDDPSLLAIAEQAAAFLTRLQQEDGNLIAGRIHANGTPVYPANLASNSCAIMLWARLFEVTGKQEYREAALRCARFTMAHWLNGKVWKMFGGEWDVPRNISASSAAYATWGFAILHRATDDQQALDAVRYSADWHRMLQARTDTHTGFYQPKAYWRGRDARSTGGFTQGVMDEGYGQLLWNRPEECYAQYLAWKVTKDRVYLDSAIAYLVWQTYMQHNCPADYRFHGGASEGYEWQWDTMNGHGTVYLGETMGCDLTLFPLLNAGVLR